MLNKEYSLDSNDDSYPKQAYGTALIGKVVRTAYGQGYVMDCRDDDDGYVYVIQLVADCDQRPLAILYSREIPIRCKTPQEEAEELNIAYESQEKMRRMNLEMECFAHGISNVLHDRCTNCLLEGKFSNTKKTTTDRNRFPRLQKIVDTARDTTESAKASAKALATDKQRFPRIRKFVGTARDVAESTTTTVSSSLRPTLQFRRSWGSSSKTATAASAASSSLSTNPDEETGSQLPRSGDGEDESDEKKTTETEDCKPEAATTNTNTTTTTTADDSSLNVPEDSPTNTAVEPNDDQKPGAKLPPSASSSKKIVLPRIQKLLGDRELVSASLCLICGNPVCVQHRSANFKKEGIVLCLSCERFFELDFIIRCVSTPDPMERAKSIDHMVDCYDRCLLILKYSTQYAEQIAQALEEKKEQKNKIGLGSSSAGVLSGALGIAAAATILTPAGPPLLIASLLFGGSATAVQAGTDAYNYFSEPNKLADRIIALHGMLFSILRVTSTLRDAMMRNHIRTDVFEAEQVSLTDAVQDTLEKNKTRVLAATNMGRAATLGSVAGAEAGAVATVGGVIATETAVGAGAQGASVLTRAGTAAARTVRFARFAGGALSAAVLVMEANAVHSTLKEIHNGNPCDKAIRIRAIAAEVMNNDLPTTSELDQECQAYLKVLASRPVPLPDVATIEASSGDMNHFPQAECAMVPHDDGVLVVDGVPGTPPVAAFTTPTATATASAESQNHRSYFTGAGSSLLQSISFGRSREPWRETTTRSDEVFAEAVTSSRRNASHQHDEWNLLL